MMDSLRRARVMLLVLADVHDDSVCRWRKPTAGAGWSQAEAESSSSHCLVLKKPSLRWIQFFSGWVATATTRLVPTTSTLTAAHSFDIQLAWMRNLGLKIAFVVK
eukprot:5512539-Amphidinium_carterae.1